MSYVYSLSPEYASRGYIGGYLIGIVLLVFAVMCWREWKNDGYGFPGFAVGISIMTAIAFWLSWYSHDTFVENPNTKIVGTLVDNYEDTVREKTGKHSYADVPYSFVIYALPDGGQVSFKRASGRVYPKNVYLYRNPSQ